MENSVTGINVEAAERIYNCKFIGDFCLKGKDGEWVDNQPVACFYVANPAKAEYSHYLGLFIHADNVYVTNAKSAFYNGRRKEIITGVKAANGQIIHSRYRHDYRVSDDESVFIDGGNAYTRTNAPNRLVNLKIQKDRLKEWKKRLIKELLS